MSTVEHGANPCRDAARLSSLHACLLLLGVKSLPSQIISICSFQGFLLTVNISSRKVVFLCFSAYSASAVVKLPSWKLKSVNKSTSSFFKNTKVL